MQVFFLTINQMVVIGLFIAAGFLLRKFKIVDQTAYANLSKLEMFVFLPALNLSNQMTMCNVDNLVKNAPMILYGGVTIVVAVIIATLIARFFVPSYKESREDNYTMNVYKYAIAFANYGYVGNFIILSIFGQEGLFQFQMFSVVLNLLTYGWGMCILIPKDRNSGIIKHIVKGLTSPPMLSVYLGMALGLTGLGPKIMGVSFINTSLTNAANCMGPIGMLLAGMVLGNYSIKGLLKQKKVYVLTAFRLVILPALYVIVHKLLGSDPMVITITLVAFAAPVGLNTIIYPSAYGGDTRPGAAMALISSLFCIVTLPLMYYFFVQVWV